MALSLHLWALQPLAHPMVVVSGNHRVLEHYPSVARDVVVIIRMLR
jgi:hypothetical protein